MVDQEKYHETLYQHSTTITETISEKWNKQTSRKSDTISHSVSMHEFPHCLMFIT